MLKDSGWKSGEAWCMYYAKSIYKKALPKLADQIQKELSGSTQGTWNKINSGDSELFKTVTSGKPKVGDIVIWRRLNDSSKGHAQLKKHEGKSYEYIKLPLTFINKESWLDDHKITPAKPPKTREKKKADTDSMVDKENSMSSEEIKSLSIKYEIELENHAENCTSCNGFFTEYESEHDAPFQFDFCEIGKPLFYEMYRLRAMAENIEPDYSITKTELIENRDDTQLSYLRLQYSHNDDLDYRQSIFDMNEETYYQMLSESYHLFKSNEV